MKARVFATLIDVSESTMSRLISGERHPSIEVMGRIKQVLGWTFDQQAAAIESGTYGSILSERIAKQVEPNNAPT